MSPAVGQAVQAYLEDPGTRAVEDPVASSVRVLLQRAEKETGGQVAIVSYAVGPRNEAGWNGRRVVSLLSLDRDVKMVRGGRIGTVALEGADLVTVAWTWLGPPEQSAYAFYGSIHIPGVRQVEVTEQDGTVLATPVSGDCGWYVTRRRDKYEGWPPQVPARIRALDGEGKVVYERRW